MSVNYRQFLHTSGRFRNEVRELLQAIFVAEFLAPSRQLWLVSPWITDVQVIDDRSGSFRILNPDLKRQSLKLSYVLGRLLDQGVRIVVVTRPDESRSFLATLNSLVADPGLGSVGELQVVERTTLHAKGLVGDDYCLSGSMNFTYSGMNRWDEMLSFHTDSGAVAQLRLEFEREYGS